MIALPSIPFCKTVIIFDVIPLCFVCYWLTFIGFVYACSVAPGFYVPPCWAPVSQPNSVPGGPPGPTPQFDESGQLLGLQSPLTSMAQTSCGPPPPNVNQRRLVQPTMDPRFTQLPQPGQAPGVGGPAMYPVNNMCIPTGATVSTHSFLNLLFTWWLWMTSSVLQLLSMYLVIDLSLRTNPHLLKFLIRTKCLEFMMAGTLRRPRSSSSIPI